jgi:hypothetical protein
MEEIASVRLRLLNVSFASLAIGALRLGKVRSYPWLTVALRKRLSASRVRADIGAPKQRHGYGRLI